MRYACTACAARAAALGREVEGDRDALFIQGTARTLFDLKLSSIYQLM